MNELIKEHTLRGLTVQRNIFLVIVFFLLVVTLALIALLFTKSERIVVVPPIVEKEFWVDGANVSATYLEQMGCFLGDLLLTRSSASADMQLTLAMRYTAPAFAGILSHKLSGELVKLRKDNASYVFFRTKVIVDPQNQIVTLEGDRSLFMGDKIISNARESYRLTFTNFGGRLLLASIERVEKTHD